MKGVVLHFDAENGTGIISAEDDSRYTFKSSEWKGGRSAIVGVSVDFVTKGDQATEIYSMQAGLSAKDAIYRDNQHARTSPLAITSLVLGIVGFLTSGLFVFSIAGIICGHIARFKIENHADLKGSGVAMAGLVINYIGLLLSVLVTFLFGLVFFASILGGN